MYKGTYGKLVTNNYMSRLMKYTFTNPKLLLLKMLCTTTLRNHMTKAGRSQTRLKGPEERYLFGSSRDRAHPWLSISRLKAILKIKYCMNRQHTRIANVQKRRFNIIFMIFLLQGFQWKNILKNFQEDEIVYRIFWESYQRNKSIR